MEITYVVAGHLTREYILPPVGTPQIDAPGGGALYACGGLLTWAQGVGVIANVGEDYPRVWLSEMEARGIDTEGVKILPHTIDLRTFVAYDSKSEGTHAAPVSQFARRNLSFPKSLLGYQAPPEIQNDTRKPDPLAPAANEIPVSYLDARAVHLCPLNFVSHHKLVAAFRAGSVTTLTLDPSVGYMNPSFLQDLRVVLADLTAFIPSEDELRSLFWGQTYDLWEMVAALGQYGCELIVVKRGDHGQALFDVKGKHKWEVPAYPARRADPTGAGDAFCGGFLAGFKKTYDPLQAALYGNVAASLKVEGSGAFYPLGVLAGLAEARLDVLKDLVRQI